MVILNISLTPEHNMLRLLYGELSVTNIFLIFEINRYISIGYVAMNRTLSIIAFFIVLISIDFHSPFLLLSLLN